MSTFKTNVMIVNITVTLNGGNGELTIPGIEIVETVEWFDDGGSTTTLDISKGAWEVLRERYGMRVFMIWGWQKEGRHIMAFGRI